MKSLHDDIAQKIKACRERAELSQEELAKKLGVRRADTISRWEKAKALPEMENIAAMASLFERPADYFLNQSFIATTYVSAIELLGAYKDSTPARQALALAILLNQPNRVADNPSLYQLVQALQKEL